MPDTPYSSEPWPNTETLPPQNDLQTFIPWQLWSTGQTINHINFVDHRVKTADKLSLSNDHSAALLTYRTAQAQGRIEAESLALRIATSELLSGKAPQSIASLSRYFQSRKQGEAQVSDLSALFFGYAYGQTRNFEQSLAWFSQAFRSDDRLTQQRSAQGIRSLLRILPHSTFEEISIVWKPNQEISRLIAQERSTRETRPFLILHPNDFFWLGGSPQSAPQTQGTDMSALNQGELPQGSARKVAVLLPLSGRFGKMGESVKAGLEIAAQHSAERGSPLELLVRDFGTDPSTYLESSEVAAPILDELVQQGASVVVGSLLSEQSFDVAEQARRHAIPAILLAKGGNAPLGEGVYRFGLTNDSQASSIVNAILRFRTNPRIALVYPSDESGLALMTAIQEVLKQRGITPLGDYPYTKGNKTEMLAHTAELEINPPEFIIFGDNLKAATTYFSSFSPRTRKAIIPVGSALWDSSIELMQSKTILSGAIFVSPFFPDRSRPEVQSFLDAYKTKTGKLADFFAAQGYDTGMLLAATPQYADARYSPPSTFNGLTGVANVTSWGEITRELAVLRLLRGQIGLLSELPESITISGTSDQEEFNSDQPSNTQQEILTDPIISE